MEFPHSESPPRRSSHEQVHIHISCLEALEGASKAGTLPDKGGPIGYLERVEVVVQRVKVLPILRIRDEWSRNVAIDRVNSVMWGGCSPTIACLPANLRHQDCPGNLAHAIHLLYYFVIRVGVLVY